MSKRRDKEYLLDIIEAIERIDEYAKGLAYPEFMQDKKTQDAVIQSKELPSLHDQLASLLAREFG